MKKNPRQQKTIDDFFKDEDLDRLSQSEKFFIMEVIRKLKDEKMHVDKETVIELWVGYKKLLATYLKKGHVHSGITSTLLYWAKYPYRHRLYMRLQCQPTGLLLTTFKRIERFFNNENYARPEIVNTFRKKLFKKWIEF